MTENQTAVKSAQEEIDVLYNLKTLVKEYRQNGNIRTIPEILKYYTAAVEISSQNEAEIKQSFAAAVAPIKKEIINSVNTTEALKKWDEIKEFSDLISVDDLNNINAKIEVSEAIRQKASAVQKEIKTLENASGEVKPAIKSRLAKSTAEDSDLVKQLKAEAIAGIEKNKTLSDEEKKQRIQKINNTPAIKVKVKGSKCSIVYDTTFEPVETALAVNGVVFEGKFSRHAKIEKVSLAELGKISASGKEFKTAIGLEQKSQSDSLKRATKKSEQDAEKRNAKLAALQNQHSELLCDYAQSKRNIGLAVIAMVDNIDDRKFYQALTEEAIKRKSLLSYLTKQNDVSDLIELIPERLADHAVRDKKVWKLFNEEENKSVSYYERCLEKVRPFPEVYKEVKEFMESGNIGQKKCDTTILKIAGMRLPKEEAADMFLSAVFHYGMGLIRDDAFNPEKFAKMNQVLNLYGYKINLHAVAIEKEPAKGAMDLSRQILEDMHSQGHKAKKNKTIAVMYKVAEYRKNHPGKTLNDIAGNPELRKLYNEFSQVFFNDRPTTDSALPDMRHQNAWMTFISDNSNLCDADKIFETFNREAKTATDLKKWIDNLSAGLNIPDITQTTHHDFDRKYGGLFANGREILNYSDNLTVTMKMHPADKDPHKEAHKFDMKMIYLYSRDGRYINSSFNNIKAGDTFYYPEVLKKRDNGNYAPIIARDTLLVTADYAIKEPNVPGRPRLLIEKYISPFTGATLQESPQRKPPENASGIYATLGR